MIVFWPESGILLSSRKRFRRLLKSEAIEYEVALSWDSEKNVFAYELILGPLELL